MAARTRWCLRFEGGNPSLSRRARKDGTLSEERFEQFSNAGGVHGWLIVDGGVEIFDLADFGLGNRL